MFKNNPSRGESAQEYMKLLVNKMQVPNFEVLHEPIPKQFYDHFISGYYKADFFYLVPDLDLKVAISMIQNLNPSNMIVMNLTYEAPRIISVVMQYQNNPETFWYRDSNDMVLTKKYKTGMDKMFQKSWGEFYTWYTKCSGNKHVWNQINELARTIT